MRVHFFAGAHTIENDIEQNIQNTKVASAKVALDTVRLKRRDSFSAEVLGRENSVHQHCGTPPLSVCRLTPRSQIKKSYGVHHFLGNTRERGMHRRSGKNGIDHRGLRP